MRGQLPHSVLLSCVATIYVASHGNAQGGAPDKLPPPVSTLVSSEFSGAEVVSATKESDDGKECYRITLMDKGTKRSVYVAPDGRFIGVITDELAATDYPAMLLVFFGCGIIGSLVAAGVRVACLQACPEKGSVLSKWLMECFGTGLVAGLLMSMVTTVPREKDWVGLALTCSVIGGLSASIVEAVVLIGSAARGHGKKWRVRLVVICSAVVVFLCLSIPVAAYHTYWLNQNMKSHALRPTVAETTMP